MGEASFAVRIRHLLGREQLDGDEAVEALIPGHVNHAHTALTDLF